MTTTVRETEGLGVTLAGTGADYNGKVGIDGNTLALTAAGTQLTIPSVDAGMYVFVKANNEPTGVTNAAKETPADVSLPTTGEYVYKVGTTGDVVLTFPASSDEREPRPCHRLQSDGRVHEYGRKGLYRNAIFR